MTERLKELREALDRSLVGIDEDPPAPSGPRHVPVTASEKVELFRSLFRGREDIFAVRFVSRKTGKAGYAPACTNKFAPGICPLPTIKCGDCTRQAFQPLTDKTLLDHLQGRHVVGVYPLLRDETCWFLAVDFDKSSWMEDAAAFAATCRSAGVPVALERSRSGNGVHAWFFFEGPVRAATARSFGSHLLTDCMTRHHQLSMDSYDRLFPSQDTMPNGRFGNLIALPLQRESRKEGNTVFLDEHLEPVADPWAFLAACSRIPVAVVERVALEALRRGNVLGVGLRTATKTTPRNRGRCRRPGRSMSTRSPILCRRKCAVSCRSASSSRSAAFPPLSSRGSSGWRRSRIRCSTASRRCASRRR